MSEWRNRQTRTFEGRVGDRAGSSPASDTKKPFICKAFGILTEGLFACLFGRILARMCDIVHLEKLQKGA